MVVLGRCSWKHHSPQFTVGPFLRDGYTLYMHLYPILVDGYALVGLVRKCKRRCKYLARGLLSLISSRKFPKTELRTHPICFCAASSKTHNVFCVFCFTYLQQWCLNTWLGHKRPNMSDGLMSFASKAQKWRRTHTKTFGWSTTLKSCACTCFGSKPCSCHLLNVWGKTTPIIPMSSDHIWP